ncbi:MAG: hypothetical protein WD048_05560 [Chitinophagales bacterium]
MIKFQRITIIFFVLLLSSKAFAFRIDGEILYLDKDENISQVAYSLYGNPTMWKSLWESRIDTSIKFPEFAYPNMAFILEDSIFPGIAKSDTLFFNMNNSHKLFLPIDSINRNINDIRNVIVEKNESDTGWNRFWMWTATILSGVIAGLITELIKRIKNRNKDE